MEYLTAPGATHYLAHFSYTNFTTATASYYDGPSNYFVQYVPSGIAGTGSSFDPDGIVTFLPGYHSGFKAMVLLGRQINWVLDGSPARMTPLGYPDVIQTSLTEVITPPSPTCPASFVPSALTYTQTGTYTHQYLGQLDSGPVAGEPVVVSSLSGPPNVTISNLTYVANDPANPMASRNPNSIYGDVVVQYGVDANAGLLLQISISGSAGLRGIVPISYQGPTGPPDNTATSVGVSSNPIYLNGGGTLIATVTDTTASGGTPTGSVTFYDIPGARAITLGTVPLAGGVASLPYAPTLGGSRTITAVYTPDDLTLFTGSTGSVSQLVKVVAQGIWVLNSDGTRAELGEDGSVLAGVGTAGRTSSPFGGIAVDANGNLWSVTSGINELNSVASDGTSAASFLGAGVNGPKAVAVDGAGYVWTANATKNSVSIFTSTGVAVTGVSGVASAGGLSGPSSISIDQSGSVWIANATGNSVTEIVGAAAPVGAPIVSEVANSGLGAKP